MNRVYTMTREARNNGATWDEAIYNNQIETVAEFGSLDEALSYFENELGGDSEIYGVE